MNNKIQTSGLRYNVADCARVIMLAMVVNKRFDLIAVCFTIRHARMELTHAVKTT